MPGRTKHDLRCICSRRPLLAYFGRDESGNPYLHQKVYKQRRLYSESIFTGGTASIKCRECFRWTNIRLTVGGEFISPPTSTEPPVLGQVPAAGE